MARQRRDAARRVLPVLRPRRECATVVPAGDRPDAGAHPQPVPAFSAPHPVCRHRHEASLCRAIWPQLPKLVCGGCRRLGETARNTAAEHRLPQPMGGRTLHRRSEEHTSELQSLMRISYAVFCLKKKTKHKKTSDSYLNHSKTNTHN